jgi:hypothetical protein
VDATDLLKIIQEFVEEISEGKIEIYNEASIQYELAIFLRQNLSDIYKVQLERNIHSPKHLPDFVPDFDQLDNKDPFKKREMDIVVFDGGQKEKHCIELKFPTNGQYPEQMFSSCKDIKFLEQLTVSGFNECYFLMFANDPLFYRDTCRSSKGGSERSELLYGIFRRKEWIKKEGKIQKPTGEVVDDLSFNDPYKIEWKPCRDKLQYFVIAVPQTLAKK